MQWSIYQIIISSVLPSIASLLRNLLNNISWQARALLWKVMVIEDSPSSNEIRWLMCIITEVTV